MQSFVGLCVLVTILGSCYEAWYSVMWTLMYDLFSVADATDVSGILTFCWGIASFIVPAFETIILSATKIRANANETFYAEMQSIDGGTTASTTTTTFTPIPTNHSQNEDVTVTRREYGNEAVMYMLCAFLLVACLSQFAMYFHIIRNSNLMNDHKKGVSVAEDEKDEECDDDTAPLLEHHD